MTHSVNGYALQMNTKTNPISIAKVLQDNLKHWIEVADKALFKEFNRYGEAQDLISDVWMSFSKKERAANIVAFAPSVEEAEKILGRQVRLYAKNSRYIPGLADLAKARSQTGNANVTICGLTSIEPTIAGSNTVEISVDAVYMKKYINEWDAMCDNGQYTIAQLRDLVKQFAVPFTTGTAEEKAAILSIFKQFTDLSPESSDILKEVMYAVVQ